MPGSRGGKLFPDCITGLSTDGRSFQTLMLNLGITNHPNESKTVFDETGGIVILDLPPLRHPIIPAWLFP